VLQSDGTTPLTGSERPDRRRAGIALRHRDYHRLRTDEPDRRDLRDRALPLRAYYLKSEQYEILGLRERMVVRLIEHPVVRRRTDRQLGHRGRSDHGARTFQLEPAAGSQGQVLG